ncbi:MAG: hypothetical protein AB1489_38940 [Acidobacteriota bacterium]
MSNHGTVKENDDCQHQSGLELEFDGMVKLNEWLINAVRVKQLKVLESCGQNGKW